MPEMSIKITINEFHRIHDAAGQARQSVRDGLDKLSPDELRQILARLQAGQHLTDSETGDDFMFAASYVDEIKLVESALASR